LARLTLQRGHQGLPDTPALEGRMHSDPAHGRSSLRLREEGRVPLPPLPKERIFMVPSTNDSDTSGFVA
jgi:hypothetical protein